MVDAEVLRRRLDALLDYIARLEAFHGDDRERFVADRDRHHLAERYLHLAVEGARYRQSSDSRCRFRGTGNLPVRRMIAYTGAALRYRVRGKLEGGLFRTRRFLDEGTFELPQSRAGALPAP